MNILSVRGLKNLGQDPNLTSLSYTTDTGHPARLIVRDLGADWS